MRIYSLRLSDDPGGVRHITAWAASPSLLSNINATIYIALAVRGAECNVVNGVQLCYIPSFRDKSPGTNYPK